MITLHCPAKVNLYLAILGKDASGYHELDTIFAKVDSLYDELQFKKADRFSFECHCTETIENNSVLKAVEVLQKHTGKIFNYKVTLTKNIPPRSGLGGGASDAASTLLFLNEHEHLGLSKGELMELATHIGMDVPFFVSGNSIARGTHYGERISALPKFPSALRIEVKLTGIEHSTPFAFQSWDEKKLKSTGNLPAFLSALQFGDPQKLLTTLHNDFEQVYPLERLTEANQRLILAGSGGAHVVVSAVGN